MIGEYSEAWPEESCQIDLMHDVFTDFHSVDTFSGGTAPKIQSQRISFETILAILKVTNMIGSIAQTTQNRRIIDPQKGRVRKLQNVPKRCRKAMARMRRKRLVV